MQTKKSVMSKLYPKGTTVDRTTTPVGNKTLPEPKRLLPYALSNIYADFPWRNQQPTLALPPHHYQSKRKNSHYQYYQTSLFERTEF